MFGSDPYHAVKTGRVGAMLQSGGLMPEVTVRELVTLVDRDSTRGRCRWTRPCSRAGVADLADGGSTSCPAARPSGSGSPWPSPGNQT